MMVEAFAPAKINLTLHITGQRGDGYHLLDSLVVFADFGDLLQLQAADEMRVQVTGPFSFGVPTDQRNLVWQAAEAAHWCGEIALNKKLPHGAGIGGGSSDAAAVLKAIEGLGNALSSDLPISLGADVPVCLRATATRMYGIGEGLTPVALPDLYALLVNPGVPVPTGPVFQALESRDNAPMSAQIPKFSTGSDCAAWLYEQRNDLEEPAIQVAPVIDRVLSDLRATKGQQLSRMSGSGATCFALYSSKKAAHMAAYEIGAEHPDWWCQVVTLT